MNRGGARRAAAETTRAPPWGGAAPGLALGTNEPRDVLSQALSAPAAARALCPQVRHPRAHCGSIRTTPHTPVHATATSRTPAIARDIHSRSSSLRKVLERPTKRTVPRQKPRRIVGGPVVTYPAHDGDLWGSVLHSR